MDLSRRHYLVEIMQDKLPVEESVTPHLEKNIENRVPQTKDQSKSVVLLAEMIENPATEHNAESGEND